MAIRIGVQVQPQHSDFLTMQRAWREVEELGVDTIYTWDHFFPLYGDPDGLHFDGLVSLTALAAATSRVKIGGLVFCNSYRNPQLLAAAHVAVDNMSGGRAILGIGAGWFEKDYDEYGYEFGTAPERLRALARDLPLMKHRIAKHNPAPVGDLPILIGGAGEKVTLRLVAEHAQMWHTFADVETYKRKSEILAEHCSKIGRDPNEIERVIGYHDNIVGQADGLAELGVTELTVGIGGNGSDGYDLEPVRELLRWRDGRS
jgi:probable F420-dependent oxidoreductase